MSTANPLLDYADLPPFAAIQAEQITPAVEAVLAAAREVISQLTADTTPATWQDFVLPLTDATEKNRQGLGTSGAFTRSGEHPSFT